MSHVERILNQYGFPFPPRQYQRSEVDRLVDADLDRGGYYWGIGSGKTFGSTLHALIRREYTGSQTLLVVPPILVLQWARWLESIKGVKVKVYYGTPKQRSKIVLDRETTFFVTTLGVLKADFSRLHETFNNRKLTVLVDEATSIKNYESDNFRAVLQMQHGQGILLLTGTPLSRPADAYAYIKLLAPGTYRTYKHFENIHAGDTDFFGNITSWRELELLKSNMAINSSKVLTSEVVEHLPQAIYCETPYLLASAHQKLYEQLAEQQLLLYEDGSKIDASTPGKLYNALQQVVLNFAHFSRNPDAKPAGFEIIDEFLEELGPDGKLVVYANYKMTIASIMQYLAGRKIRAVQINGDVSTTEKFKNVDLFKSDKNCRVIVMNPISGGVGVDGLQEVCSAGLFVELPTVPWHFQQAVGRLERGGQKAPPVIKIAIAQKTVQVTLRANLLENDQLINRVHQSYRDLRAALRGGG